MAAGFLVDYFLTYNNTDLEDLIGSILIIISVNWGNFRAIWVRLMYLAKFKEYEGEIDRDLGPEVSVAYTLEKRHV